MRKLCHAVPILLAAGLIVMGCAKQMPTDLQLSKSSASSRAGTGDSDNGRGPVAFGPGGALGDFVWRDLNVNGVQDGGEPGISGATVTLTPVEVAGASTVTAGELQTTTDENGFYQFIGLLPGEYVVTVKTPEDCEPTTCYATKPELDSNCSPEKVKVGDVADNTIDFGFVCKPPDEDCGPCEGKVTELTLRYNGTIANARIRVVMRQPRTQVFDGIVQPGETFSLVGADRKGTLSPEIDLYVNGVKVTTIHTSCSQPIGPGLVRGPFEVISGSSRNGGLLCPVD